MTYNLGNKQHLMHPLGLPEVIDTSESISNANYLNVASRPLLYERRGSALFDFAKSKSLQRIKRRRHGIIATSRPLLIPEESQSHLTTVSHGKSPETSKNSSCRSSRSTESLEKVEGNDSDQGKRANCASTNPRDSGVSLAFDNLVYTD